MNKVRRRAICNLQPKFENYSRKRNSDMTSIVFDVIYRDDIGAYIITKKYPFQ